MVVKKKQEKKNHFSDVRALHQLNATDHLIKLMGIMWIFALLHSFTVRLAEVFDSLYDMHNILDHLF